MMRALIGQFISLVFIFFACQISFGAASTANIVSINTATTNITTSAYVTLTTSAPCTPSQMIFVNNTSSVLKLAVGAVGSEVDFVSVSPSNQIIVEQLSRHIIAGNRLSVEAISATASTGYVSVSLIP